ncbi:MAG: chloride channel protein, partial [Syntrophomonadaceae bacterium]|nr:chloride channel protein [Syntrophomonadaceae bacterium]
MALHFPEPTYLLLVAALIGVGTGYGAVGFRLLIDFFKDCFFDGGKEALSFLGPYYVVLIPAAGGAIVGPIVYWFAREAKGHGVPEVMAAVAEKGGFIRPRLVLVKALASSISI